MKQCEHGYTDKCPQCREERECAEARAHLEWLNSEIARLMIECDAWRGGAERYLAEIAALKAEPMVPLRLVELWHKDVLTVGQGVEVDDIIASVGGRP